MQPLPSLDNPSISERRAPRREPVLTGNAVVDLVTEIEHWLRARRLGFDSWNYHITRGRQAQADPIAVAVFRKLYDWHRATKRDGRWAPRFSGDRLHMTDNTLALELNLPKQAVTDARKRLMGLGLVRYELENNRRPFMTLEPATVAAITHPVEVYSVYKAKLGVRLHRRDSALHHLVATRIDDVVRGGYLSTPINQLLKDTGPLMTLGDDVPPGPPTASPPPNSVTDNALPIDRPLPGQGWTDSDAGMAVEEEGGGEDVAGRPGLVGAGLSSTGDGSPQGARSVTISCTPSQRPAWIPSPPVSTVQKATADAPTAEENWTDPDTGRTGIIPVLGEMAMASADDHDPVEVFLAKVRATKWPSPLNVAERAYKVALGSVLGQPDWLSRLHYFDEEDARSVRKEAYREAITRLGSDLVEQVDAKLAAHMARGLNPRTAAVKAMASAVLSLTVRATGHKPAHEKLYPVLYDLYDHVFREGYPFAAASVFGCEAYDYAGYDPYGGDSPPFSQDLVAALNSLTPEAELQIEQERREQLLSWARKFLQELTELTYGIGAEAADGSIRRTIEEWFRQQHGLPESKEVFMWHVGAQLEPGHASPRATVVWHPWSMQQAGRADGTPYREDVDG